MEENKDQHPGDDIRAIVRGAIQEFLNMEHAKAEPVYKTELVEERKRRESLERRMNELIEENRRSRQIAEEADRSTTIRSELQRMGVTKIDLAFRAVKDDIVRGEDGRLVARTGAGESSVKEFLTEFLTENPELLPARIAGGSGASAAHKMPQQTSGAIDLDRIRPGMSAEELVKVREEISRLAGEELRRR